MTKIFKSPNFTHVGTIEQLISSPSDSCYNASPELTGYTVSGADLIDLSGVKSPARSRKEGCSYLGEQMNIPELVVSSMHNAIIFPGKIRKRDGAWHSHGQLVLDSRNNITPESYGVMDGGKTLPSDLLIEREDTSLELAVATENLPRLQGTYLFLGSMHDHFGHFLVEGLSRLWALNLLDKDYLDSLKIVIYEPGLIPPATKILSYLGIEKSRLIFLDSPHIVERIITPAIAYRTHFWAREEMNYVYNKIATAAQMEKPTDFPTKIFLSRNNVSSRKLENETELEDMYRQAGYWVIRPEDLPIGDQIRIISEAESVAGCTGSNMYLCIFQKPGGSNHVYAPFDFNLKDDAMISKLRRSNLTYILGSKLSNDCWSVDISKVKALVELQ